MGRGHKGRKNRGKQHKHQWRKVGGTYSAKLGLTNTIKRCVVDGCKATKEV